MNMSSLLRTSLLALARAAWRWMMAQGKINPTDPQPTCNMCPGTYIPLSELEAYTKKAIAENLVDQQVRDIEIGKAHVGIGMVYRGKLDKPARGLGRRTRSGQRGLSHHLRLGDARPRPGHHQPAAASGDAADRRRVQRTGQQRIGDPERRRAPAQGRATSWSFRRAPATGSRRSTTTSTT